MDIIFPRMWKIILQIELGCHVGGLLPHQPECVWHQQIIWGWLLSITVLLNFLNSLHMVRIYNYHEGFYQHICLSRCGLEMLTRDILWLVSCFVKSFFFFFSSLPNMSTYPIPVVYLPNFNWYYWDITLQGSFRFTCFRTRLLWICDIDTQFEVGIWKCREQCALI